MNLFGIAACAVCAAALTALLRNSSGEYAVLLGGAACVVILLSVGKSLAPLVEQISSLTGSGISGEILAVVLKTVGLAITCQMASHVCRDAGGSALAYAVELAGKAAILAAAMPLFLKVFDCLEKIVKF